MNCLFQRTDNIKENKRKNWLAKPGADLPLASARVPHFWEVPKIYGASRFLGPPCFSERRPHCTFFGGHITYVAGRMGPAF